jgi:pyruvate carboxylase
MSTIFSVLPTRFFLGKPPVGEEIHIAIEKGKVLIVKLVAVSPVNIDTGIRDILFELNGELRAVQVEDKNAAIETIRREKATSEPGSIGCKFESRSGVVELVS